MNVGPLPLPTNQMEAARRTRRRTRTGRPNLIVRERIDRLFQQIRQTVVLIGESLCINDITGGQK